MKKKELLIEQFANAVVSQRQCVLDGDFKTGNQWAHSYVAAARELLDGGEESIEAFAALLLHSDEGVRCMAAAFLLKCRTTQSLVALTSVAKGAGLDALGARETLRRYERGDLEVR
jgi:hypothetical protein